MLVKTVRTVQDYDRLRPLSYPSTDVFVVCFGISARDSFENVGFLWMPELEHHCPGVPRLLVGIKSDLKGCEGGVTYEEGVSKARDIGALGYLECSALTGDGVDEVFLQAGRIALASDLYADAYVQEDSGSGKCVLS
jgi:small GTP-binding protein